MELNESKLRKLFPQVSPKTIKDLDKGLRLFKDGDLECWYCPLGRINRKARIALYGITPAWIQMKIAYDIALGKEKSENRIKKMSKIAFAGSMRANLVSMMDELGINKSFESGTFSDLFGTELLAYSSVLKYPVFHRGKNYNGHTPRLLKQPLLKDMLETILISELQEIGNCLIVPLGKSAEEGIRHVSIKAGLKKDQVLLGFPHPSGANAHRKIQFDKNKKDLKASLNNWFL